MSTAKAQNARVALVAGLRSPFCKQGSDLSSLTALELLAEVSKELIARAEFDPQYLDNVVMGQVVPNIAAANIARELVLRLDLPRTIPGDTVSRACASSADAIAIAIDAIRLGRDNVALVGGVDVLSDVPVMFSRSFAEVLLKASQAKSTSARIKAFASLRLNDLRPMTPSITELSTGLRMGDHAEAMAKINQISRHDQDEFAARSHQLAVAAIDDGRIGAELAPIFVPATGRVVDSDNHPRRDSSLEALARLKPVFDPQHGSVTAGNSCPVSDGAAALLLMAEQRARELGFQPLAFVLDYTFVGVDPDWQLLIGPSLAIAKLLDRTGLALDEMDLIDMHEAFAAQVLSNLQALGSPEFARQHLQRSQAVGEVDMARFNVMGGSIALGHPFAATAARQVLSAANELRRRGGRYALLSQCAAGGMGAAMIIENPEVSQ